MLLPQQLLARAGCSSRTHLAAAASARHARPRSMSAAAAAASAAPPALTGFIPGFRQRVAEVNNGLSHASELMPFLVEGQRLGCVRHDFAQRLAAFPEVFRVQQQDASRAGAQQQVLTLAPGLSTTEARSAAVAGVLGELRSKQGLLSGWRDELYPVAPAFDAPPLLLIERAAAPFFGIRAYGVHVNGYVVQPDGTKQLWVARRSTSKQTWPGKLDHIVAGGQPYGLSCADNVAKECWEEAGIPAALAAAARPAGFVSYVSLSDEGLKPDVLMCFDLQLPPDFVPQAQDGEVQEFMLWDLERVAAVVSGSDEYKPNCCLVIIDFLARHGCIAPDEPGYLELLVALRAGDAR